VLFIERVKPLEADKERKKLGGLTISSRQDAMFCRKQTAGNAPYCYRNSVLKIKVPDSVAGAIPLNEVYNIC
jgi:hypothetical protein